MIEEKYEFPFDRAYRFRKEAFNIYQAYDKRKSFTFTANHKITHGWQFLL